MRVQYYTDSDMLIIDLSSEPATGGGEDVAEGVVFFYDDNDQIVSIEIDSASRRVDLRDIKKNPKNLVDDSGPPVIVWTLAMLAEEWGLQVRTLRRTIETMRAAGEAVGLQQAPNHPILLTDEDVTKVKVWRKAHPHGRQKTEKQGTTV